SPRAAPVGARRGAARRPAGGRQGRSRPFLPPGGPARFSFRFPAPFSDSMFDQLSERLQGVIENLRGRGRLTEENINDTMRQVRMALLEADVALPVVKTFIDTIRSKVVGMEIDKS